MFFKKSCIPLVHMENGKYKQDKLFKILTFFKILASFKKFNFLFPQYVIFFSTDSDFSKSRFN